MISVRMLLTLGSLKKGHLVVALFLFLFPAIAWSHPGGLDVHGCHDDRKAGGYHCHRGPMAGQSYASKAEMLRWLEETGGTSPKRSAAIVVSVVRVIDGDTISVCCLAGREERVRYIGVNTPEVHHPTKGEEPGGREATEVNRQLVGGRQVRLDLDVQERDRYGRVLAYVWMDRGGEAVMVNAELVRRGYAQVMTIPPNVKYQELFLKLQREAREVGRGLWRK